MIIHTFGPFARDVVVITAPMSCFIGQGRCSGSCRGRGKRRPLIDGVRMPHFKSGDLVVLKSGGPTMTVDTVNTDIFDDNKMTGLLCVWFVGKKLERVRFDHRAV